MSLFQSSTATIKKLSSSFTLSTPVAIIIAALILGGSHIVYGMVAGSTTKANETQFFAGKPIDKADYVEGDDSSDVIIVEYSDPECPYCVTLHPTMKQLRNEYEGKVAFVYRHFPLTQIHPNAFDESKAIACAGTLGGTKAFYSYVDSLYGYKSTNQTTQLPPTGKEDTAANLGLDKAAFIACLNDAKSAEAINGSLNDGLQAGVQGTPSTFILKNTRKGLEIVAMLDGARQYDYFKAAIDQALAQ